MTSTTLRSRVLSEWIALPLLLALALSAQAQQTPKVAVQDELQEVVVTGSRIARPELDNLQPTTVIDSKTFDQRGYLDVGQALSELPQFGIQPSSAQNAQSNSGIAQSFVDLYSLGSQRTLVLVNGRRFPSSSTASLGNSNSIDTIGGPGSQVDLNTIPTKLIDHVETIAVGGAPIYGADAIAGTVNIILKKDYEGLDVDGQVGASGQGDAWNYRARALFGQNFFDNRANITGVAEFTKTDGLNGLSRPIFSESSAYLPPATPGKFGNVLTPNLAIPAVSFGGVPMVDDSFLAPAVGLTGPLVGVTNAAGQTLAFGPGGSLVPYNVGKNTGNPVFTSGGDGLQLAQVSNLLSPTERINFDVLPNFKVNDSLTLFGEGWFSETHATNLVSQPAYNSALFGIAGGKLGGNFVISLNNPFLSAADRQTIQTALNNYAATLPFGAPLYQGVAAGPGQPIGYPAWNNQQFYLGRASVDLQNDGATATQVLARGVLGANGKFSFGDRNFTWDVAGSYGTSSNTSSTPSYVFQNLENALNATTNAQGQIVCGGTPVNAPISTGSSTCAPLNIFGNGSPSAASLAYITHMAEATSLDSQRDFSANLQADVWKLPGGEWKAAVGFENRRESADFSPDAFYTENLGYGTATAIEGSYITNELYLETLIPIFGPAQDIPFLHSLEAESAARRVDNSLAGDATTYTYGLRWSPVPDVQFRGNKTKSIRAPSITELFLPSATSFQFADDPCDKNFYQQGTAPATRLKNCEAAGINPATFNSNAVGATVQGLTGGNPDLMSETAFSKTYGVVLRPR
jgi:iron complex outermembrane receptor protein